MNPPEIVAAGAVLWRPSSDGIQVALVHRPKYGDWTIPKGKPKKQEHLLRTARREVREETGIRPVLGRRLAPSYYQKNGRSKRVDYWVATPAPDRRVTEPAGKDVDAVEWLAVEDAASMLSYERDLAVLRDFVDGPKATIPLILLSAADESSAAQQAENFLRPLSSDGRGDASKLAKLLACFGRCEAISAPSAIAIETLLPYAIKQDVSIATDNAFTSRNTSPRQARSRVEELISTRLVPRIVCAPSDLIPTLVESVCARLGAATPPATASEQGAFWVAQLSQERLAEIEHHTLVPARAATR